jgi:hypothetical protein
VRSLVLPVLKLFVHMEREKVLTLVDVVAPSLEVQLLVLWVLKLSAAQRVGTVAWGAGLGPDPGPDLAVDLASREADASTIDPRHAPDSSAGSLEANLLGLVFASQPRHSQRKRVPCLKTLLA